MTELSFEVELEWSGKGPDGAGVISGDDVTIDLSTPEAMGGRGVGSNPEELLVCAVASCYTATLFSILSRDHLPVDAVVARARGGVSGFPRRGRVSRIAVSPTILGGDVARWAEYETAAILAHEHCLIGNALSPEVSYEVGPVAIRNDGPTPTGDARKDAHHGEVSQDVPAWLSGS